MGFYNELCKKMASFETAYIKTSLQTGEKAFISKTEHIGLDTNFLTEEIAPKQNLVICGAGHVSKALHKVCKELGFVITVIDERPEFANTTRFEGANVICDDFKKALNTVPHTLNTYFAVLTRGHSDDMLCVSEILNKPYAYVGMIGSKRKNALVFEALLADGFTQNKINDVCAPIGIDIKAQTPEEIAISIAAQLILYKNQNSPQSTIETDILNAIIENKVAALATLAQKKGSAPRGVGAKLALLKSGDILGTVGGGKAEAFTIKQMKNHETAPVLLEIEMTNDDAKQNGMICGGVVKVLIEYF